MLNLYASLGFYEPPNLPLEVAAAADPTSLPAALGEDSTGSLTLTPLQMAQAVAALTNGGVRHAPQIANAVKTGDGNWSILPAGPVQTTLLAGGASATMNVMAIPGVPFWETVAVTHASGQAVTWYLAGALPDWQGTQFAVAIVLEEDNPALAKEIGQSLFLK
jgi:hypothetical protein